jgi:N-methylhydantoinase B
LTGGGGGWGSAFEREPERVALDVQYGFVTVEHAKSAYGVVIKNDSFDVDVEATKKLRQEIGR